MVMTSMKWCINIDWWLCNGDDNVVLVVRVWRYCIGVVLRMWCCGKCGVDLQWWW